MHAFMYTCIHIYTYIKIYWYIYTYMLVCTCICICIFSYSYNQNSNLTAPDIFIQTLWKHMRSRFWIRCWAKEWIWGILRCVAYTRATRQKCRERRFCLQSNLFVVDRTQEKLLGFYRVSNPSTQNSRVWTRFNY